MKKLYGYEIENEYPFRIRLKWGRAINGYVCLPDVREGDKSVDEVSVREENVVVIGYLEKLMREANYALLNRACR